MTSPDPNEVRVRIWHVPQIPCEAFRVEVPSIAHAELLLDVLARYDAFQFYHRIKPDYSNVGGIEVFKWGEWWDYDPDDGVDEGVTDVLAGEL